jgi:Ca2+-transporting ATPase
MFYNKTVEQTYKALNTTEKGLSSNEAARRLEDYGPNEITEKKAISKIKIFISQFNSFIVYILIAAVLISMVIGEYVDSVVILIILILNAVLGFVQEYRAEKSIAALKKLASLKATVVRDGKEKEIEAEGIVPGDIIILETGGKVPADARLVEVVNLQTHEAALTGESLPIKKEMKVYTKKMVLGDQKNMVFSGTIVTAGRGKAVVTATGMNTQIGKIAGMMHEMKEELTPLQKKLQTFGKWLGILIIIICAFVFVVGIVREYLTVGVLQLEFVNMMFLVAIALAVAAIPEGLPAVVTISLGIGTQRMIKRNALIRTLPSVETLGSVTVICTDKTGTLTKNEMTVRKVYTNGKIVEVIGSGYKTKGKFILDGRPFNPREVELLLRIGALNNNARLRANSIIGDPTEVALIVSAAKAGLVKENLEEKYPRIGEISFDSQRKRMSTIHRIGKETVMYTKGAPEVIVGLCNRIYENGEVRTITEEDKKRILKVNEDFANEALRVLAFAYKNVITGTSEKNLVFVGLQGMIDPPRTEVKEAVVKCKKAGIKVVMITGDFEITAKAIAREIGLEGKSITGNDLDKVTSLDDIVDDVSIYARVNPEHKMKIIAALKKKGHIVAMTGDGVNDAPALKQADIGIAMGIKGTDVAKEASDMILTDDNFASIVNAVEEGRGIYDNIKKFINYLLSSNFGEVLVLFVAMLIGFRDPSGSIAIPLIAVQILWMNLITDGFPALALGVDTASPRIMDRKPRKTNENIITLNMGLNILIIGILICSATLFLFDKYIVLDLEEARTVAFTTLVILQIVRVHMVRSQYDVGIFSNKYLTYAITFSIILQLTVIYTPLSRIFRTVGLGVGEWLWIVVVSMIVFAIGYITSILIRRLTHERD